MALSDRIIETLERYSIKEMAVVVDGFYFTVKSKMVYVKLKQDEHFDAQNSERLFFYTHASSDGRQSKNEETEITDAIERLRIKLKRSSIGETQLGIDGDCDKCSITVCDNVRILLLESQLYRSVRKLVEEGKENNSTFMFGDSAVDQQSIRALCSAFKKESYSSYADLIYSAKSHRFLNKLQNYNKFYRTQRAFIPVFVDYKNVYNPLDDNKVLKKSVLYKTAVEKGRKIVIDNLSCYMLTHLEICQSLGMKYFMRFTPSFLYMLLVGLLNPSYTEFPNKGNTFYYNLNGGTTKRRLSMTEYQQRLEKAVEKAERATDEAERTEALAEQNELMNYQEIDSLYYAIIRDYSKLISIGSNILDDKNLTSQAQLYSYVKDATILY